MARKPPIGLAEGAELRVARDRSSGEVRDVSRCSRPMLRRTLRNVVGAVTPADRARSTSRHRTCVTSSQSRESLGYRISFDDRRVDAHLATARHATLGGLLDDSREQPVFRDLAVEKLPEPEPSSSRPEPSCRRSGRSADRTRDCLSLPTGAPHSSTSSGASERANPQCDFRGAYPCGRHDVRFA